MAPIISINHWTYLKLFLSYISQINQKQKACMAVRGKGRCNKHKLTPRTISTDHHTISMLQWPILWSLFFKLDDIFPTVSHLKWTVRILTMIFFLISSNVWQTGHLKSVLMYPFGQAGHNVLTASYCKGFDHSGANNISHTARHIHSFHASPGFHIIFQSMSWKSPELLLNLNDVNCARCLDNSSLEAKMNSFHVSQCM